MNPTTSSQGTVKTRKCDADANTNAEARANGIYTKINMPPPKGGGT